MERAPKVKPIEGYFEKHRIVPGCMGGEYVIGNIAWLTPEEHFVAHQLLVKIYPEHKGLIFAAIAMTSKNNKFQKRSYNKTYGWLKRIASLNSKGQPKTEEHRKNISIALKKRFKTNPRPPRKQGIQEKQKRRKIMTGNQFAAGHQNVKGKTWKLSPESKLKHSIALKNKPKSESHKEALRKPKSPAAKEAMRLAAIKRWTKSLIDPLHHTDTLL